MLGSHGGGGAGRMMVGSERRERFVRLVAGFLVILASGRNGHRGVDAREWSGILVLGNIFVGNPPNYPTHFSAFCLFACRFVLCHTSSSPQRV